MSIAPSVVHWIRRKRRLTKQLLPQLPKHTYCIEPCCGAVARFSLKAAASAEVLNALLPSFPLSPGP